MSTGVKVIGAAGAAAGVLEPNRFLGLHGHADLRGRWLDPDQPRPAAYMEALWGFLLSEPGRRMAVLDREGCRLPP